MSEPCMRLNIEKHGQKVFKKSHLPYSTDQKSLYRKTGFYGSSKQSAAVPLYCCTTVLTSAVISVLLLYSSSVLSSRDVISL